MIHKVDGLMYMDGANLNALVGMVNPAKMGFDITHINVHKTFSTPHGGGGPGAGPIGVVEKLKKHLPVPIVDHNDDGYFLNYDLKESIGRIHSFFGNVGVLVRAYCYIKTLGSDGLWNVSKNAIINANYIKKKLSHLYSVPYSDGTMHEFVISAQNQKERGLKALDIAKIILDHGFHAPTIYFPINVKESIMIEPTETESKETLDSFIDLMLSIDARINKDLNHLLDAPTNTPVRRLNETKANRELNLNWKNEL
jgi:glycine dehydrogenase subunit 2